MKTLINILLYLSRTTVISNYALHAVDGMRAMMPEGLSSQKTGLVRGITICEEATNFGGCLLVVGCMFKYTVTSRRVRVTEPSFVLGASELTGARHL